MVKLISTTILNSDKEISLDSHIIAIVSNQGTRFSKTQLWFKTLILANSNKWRQHCNLLLGKINQYYHSEFWQRNQFGFTYYCKWVIRVLNFAVSHKYDSFSENLLQQVFCMLSVSIIQVGHLKLESHDKSWTEKWWPTKN